MTMMKYNFDEIVNTNNDIRRKWNKDIIKNVFNIEPTENFIPLWIADMDFKVPENLKSEIIKFISESNMGYTFLTDDFFNCIINWYNRRKNIVLKKEWINITYGTVGALHILNQVFLNENDCSLILTPVYEPFKNAATDNNRNIVTSKLIIKENRYYINFLDVENKIKKFHPKLFILCNPHNPSGRIWNLNELNKIAKLCYENDVILVSDEVHSEMIHIGKYYSSLNIDNKYINNLIVLSSPNKAFNLGGLKTSYSIIPNKLLREKFKCGMKKNSVTSPNIIGLICLVTAYNKCENWLDELTKYIYENYKLFSSNLEKIGLSYQKMESSYLIWVNLENTKKDGKWWTTKLKEKGILVETGYDFIENGENFIRINLGIPRKYLFKVLEIMKEECYELTRNSK